MRVAWVLAVLASTVEPTVGEKLVAHARTFLGTPYVLGGRSGAGIDCGKWIVGDHFAGQVVETDLAAYLKEHADTYEGVWVLRPAKVAPTKCRRHDPRF